MLQVQFTPLTVKLVKVHCLRLVHTNLPRRFTLEYHPGIFFARLDALSINRLLLIQDLDHFAVDVAR